MTNLWGTPVKPADVSVIPYSIDTYVTWGYSKIFKLYLLVSTYPNSTPVEIKHKGHALIWMSFDSKLDMFKIIKSQTFMLHKEPMLLL